MASQAYRTREDVLKCPEYQSFPLRDRRPCSLDIGAAYTASRRVLGSLAADGGAACVRFGKHTPRHCLMVQGAYFDVWETSPALCLFNRERKSAVTPT
jgi:hypothetical protein